MRAGGGSAETCLRARLPRSPDAILITSWCHRQNSRFQQSVAAEGGADAETIAEAEREFRRSIVIAIEVLRKKTTSAWRPKRPVCA